MVVMLQLSQRMLNKRAKDFSALAWLVVGSLHVALPGRALNCEELDYDNRILVQ